MRILRLAAMAFLTGTACNVVSAQEYVDLGLSVKWCTVNTGVTAERPYGWYYRWPDAMAIKTTGGSRMATKAEWNELLDLCTWKWTEQNGTGGYLVTSNIKGYKDKSIFLPAAGWLQDGSLMQTGIYASYWTSTPGVQPDEESAYGFNFQRGATEWHSENRESEQSVRMVMPLSGKELSRLSIDRRKLALEQGTTARLGVSMSGGKRNVNSACVWESSDENVVSVMDDGLIVAVAPGSCRLTASAYGKTAECSVTVTPHEYGYVDMGLSVLWATCNLGASAPQALGDFYAWAEIEPKEFFSWGNYRYCSFPQANGMDKYTVEGSTHQYLAPDNLTRLEAADDVATVLLGKEWHIPTNEEFAELVRNSTLDTLTVDGMAGIRFTSKVPGFEGRSIFIPYSGEMNGNEPLDRGKQLALWSSMAGSGSQGGCFSTISRLNGMVGMDDMSPLEVLRMAVDLSMGSNCYENRFIGMNVRPVRSLTEDMFATLSLPAGSLLLSYGEMHNLNAVMMPSGRPVNQTSVTWSSSAPGVVSVYSDGSITAVGIGECVITAESGGRKAQMHVSVGKTFPEPVDLGLSVKWASANLGATHPGDAGGYFAWGETSPKTGPYTREKYRFMNKNGEKTKYDFGSVFRSNHPLDCKENLDPEDDVARAVLGNGWRMPDVHELWELQNFCTWETIKTEDSSGYLITSRVPGFEGNSIFLPFAGYVSDFVLRGEGVIQGKGYSANYLTSTLEQGIGDSRIWTGQSVRPVLELTPEEKETRKAITFAGEPAGPSVHNMVDLGLSVLWADCNLGSASPEQPGGKYSWGETSEKIYYSKYNYRYMKYFEDENWWWYSKYIGNDKNYHESFVDGKTRLDPEDDAVHVNWGGEWRTPTKEEYAELFRNCECTPDTINGVRGYTFRSKVPGYTSNSIFLPYTSGDAFAQGRYMTSDLSSGYTHSCACFMISASPVGTTEEIDLGLERMAQFHITSTGRDGALSIRAVCPKTGKNR